MVEGNPHGAAHCVSSHPWRNLTDSPVSASSWTPHFGPANNGNGISDRPSADGSLLGIPALGCESRSVNHEESQVCLLQTLGKIHLGRGLTPRCRKQVGEQVDVILKPRPQVPRGLLLSVTGLGARPLRPGVSHLPSGQTSGRFTDLWADSSVLTTGSFGFYDTPLSG